MNLRIESDLTPQTLRHGGDLSEAVSLYGGSQSDWLDLSTGISPWAYPIPTVHELLWQSLPNSPDSLIDTAACYYGCEASNLILSPGSQLAIRLIPALIKKQQTVAVPSIGYQEHAHSWQLAGHRIIRYRNLSQLKTLITEQSVQNVVVINPNNPSCEKISALELRSLARQISGVLIVDEAFADLDASNSLSRDSNLCNIIILRSIGKFFGLAGARVGFVITQHPIASKLVNLLSPWSINSPAQQIAELALRDNEWQVRQRLRITSQATELNTLLIDSKDQNKHSYRPDSQGLFTTIFDSNDVIQYLHEQLCNRLIWTRIGDSYRPTKDSNKSQNWLRLSLPGNRFELLSQVFNSIS